MSPILRRALTGHTSASVGDGNGVPLDVFAEAMAKISYKGLDLSDLYVMKWPILLLTERSPYHLW